MALPCRCICVCDVSLDHVCVFCLPLQSDMQRGVHCRLMDNSTSVREAAVELLGRFVLCRPQLTEQYYDMLIERILVRVP